MVKRHGVGERSVGVVLVVVVEDTSMVPWHRRSSLTFLLSQLPFVDAGAVIVQ